MENLNYIFPKEFVEENTYIKEEFIRFFNDEFGDVVFNNIDDAYTALQNEKIIVGIEFELYMGEPSFWFGTAYKKFNDKMITVFKFPLDNPNEPYNIKPYTILAYFGEDADKHLKKIIDSKHHFFILGDDIVKIED